MHDPTSVAHDIRLFGRSILTIWHVDPETDGTDDSCGWFSPKLTRREDKIIDDIANWEKDFPYYSSPHLPLTVVNPKYNYKEILAGDCLAYVSGAWKHIAWDRDRRKKLTAAEWWSVVELSTTPSDNLRAILADREENVAYRVTRFFSCVMKAYLRHHRPWWKHPRWHIHHWQFQIHFIQTLRRWLFSRCTHCEKRFSWGYSPISTGNSGGLRWFKSEENCYHHQCYEQSEVVKTDEMTRADEVLNVRQ